MKRMAIFLEGFTELLFIEKLTYELAELAMFKSTRLN